MSYECTNVVTHWCAYLCTCCQPLAKICLRSWKFPACSGGQIALSYFERPCVVTYRSAYLFSELSTLSLVRCGAYETELLHCAMCNMICSLCIMQCTAVQLCRGQISWSNAVTGSARPSWQHFLNLTQLQRSSYPAQMLYHRIFFTSHLLLCIHHISLWQVLS